MRSLYNYLPTDDSPHHAAFHIPSKVSLEGKINALKQQSHCLGTYVRVESREVHGLPMFKHATADLVLAKSKTVGEDGDEDGWVISRWATFSVNAKEQRCMQVACPGMPFDAKTDGKWSEWSGRKWIPAESVHLRPSYHGFGHTPSGSVHNIYSASDDVRRRAVSPSKQRGPSRSPPKV